MYFWQSDAKYIFSKSWNIRKKFYHATLTLFLEVKQVLGSVVFSRTNRERRSSLPKLLRRQQIDHIDLTRHLENAALRHDHLISANGRDIKIRKKLYFRIINSQQSRSSYVGNLLVLNQIYNDVARLAKRRLEKKFLRSQREHPTSRLTNDNMASSDPIATNSDIRSQPEHCCPGISASLRCLAFTYRC